jgi:hypothetical protein
MNPDFARDLAGHKQVLFQYFRELVPVLAGALPNHSVVVRPHPSEDHQAWRDAARDHDNVHVLNEKSVIPWLIAAKALIHNGCTTAVEAAVLGVPAVAYRPVTRKGCDFEFPNELSHQVYDLQDLLGAVRKIVAGELGSQNGDTRHAVLEQHLAFLEGPLAIDRVVAALSEAGTRERLLERPPLLGYLSGLLHAHARTVSKRINRLRRGHRNTKEFHDHRFPGTSVDELRERVQRFSRQLDRFESLEVRQLSDHVYCIEGGRRGFASHEAPPLDSPREAHP